MSDVHIALVTDWKDINGKFSIDIGQRINISYLKYTMLPDNKILWKCVVVNLFF